MKLAALIQMGGLQAAATATVATVATEGADKAGTVARVARVAVATDQIAANDDADTLPDPAAEARRQRAELVRLLDRLAEETGYFTETDKLEALEVALRDPAAWRAYLPLLLERCAAGVH